MGLRRLLIADDDAGMRAALEARFRGRGWEVDVAVNGTEALAKFRPGVHALVISDVRMPGCDGFEVMRTVQNSSDGTAVILLTAYGCVPDAVEAMRNGACDYGTIGDWIEKLGFASEREVTAALALQWGCPVASSFDFSADNSHAYIPLAILEAFRMIPFRYFASTRTLSLAFGARVDHAALYAIEKILDCRTQPCVSSPRSIARQLERLRQIPHPNDVEFFTRDFSEMARITSSYIARVCPDEVRLSRMGRFIWLRLKRETTLTNVVFCLERPNKSPQSSPPFVSSSLVPSVQENA
jgi:CheY-like chemotaxis protein